MAMSKKHYTAIANVLNHYYHNSSEELIAIGIGYALAQVFTADNPRFDSDRFISAVKQYPATASSF